MKMRELEMALAAADPVGRDRLEGLDPGAMEAELLVDLENERPASPSPGSASPPRRRRRRLALAFGTAVLASLAAVVVLLAGGTSEHPSRAYAADLVRFAESTPLLLLEGPGWRVQDVYEEEDGYGSMEFVTGKPIPYESIQVTGNMEGGERESGMLPPATRQRRVELRWFHGSLAEALSTARGSLHPHGQHWVKAPVLETTATVDTRAEFYVNQGGPGNRRMTAIWGEDGHVLELSAAVPGLPAFEERLDWLTRVDSKTWLDAMPAKVVKAADHDATVREMLQGIPVPKGFEPSQIPNPGLTTNRYQVGATVTGTVGCLWFAQWGEARRSGDTRAKTEAEQAMATSKHWKILREMAKDGAFPETIWTLAAEMPSGAWVWNGHEHPLLPKAESLGCARRGMPLLPWKQRRQREREAEAHT